MIRKLRNFCENVLSTKGVIWISVIIFIAVTSFLLITEFKDVLDLLTYPEEEYQLLEAEAEKIVSNKDFESEYSYKIETSKKDDIKHLKMEMDLDMAKVIIEFENFDSPEQTVIIEREFEEPVKYLVGIIILLIITIVMATVAIDCVVIIPVIILSFILWIVSQINNYIDKKRGNRFNDTR